MILGQGQSEPAGNHYGQAVKRINHPFQFVYGILDHLFDDDCKPQGVEFRHEITECVHEAHRLAELRWEAPRCEGDAS